LRNAWNTQSFVHFAPSSIAGKPYQAFAVGSLLVSKGLAWIEFEWKSKSLARLGSILNGRQKAWIGKDRSLATDEKAWISKDRSAEGLDQLGSIQAKPSPPSPSPFGLTAHL